MKNYKKQNVLDAAYDRLNIIFEEFENVVFSVSGGKDSSVMVQLADEVAEKHNKKYDVLYVDLEAQYEKTIDHINDLKQGLKNVKTFYHIALPLYLRNAVSQLQPKWICWNEKEKDLWVRKLPKDSININNHEFDFYNRPIEFEEFLPEFTKWYKKNHKGKIAFGVGIRSDESLNRWRTITSDKKETYKNHQWTTLLKFNSKAVEGAYNVYPVYDWKTQDIWGCVAKKDLMFNEIYDLMYKNGLSIHEQRLCQPYGDDQKNGLDQFKALESHTWEKILNRVNGVNFGNIYARTSALGNLKTSKPDFMTWEQYAVYLLESLKIYNEDLMYHYVEKIQKFMKWYKKNWDMEEKDIPDKAEDPRLEAQRKTISWKRIARAIERNDFYMKRLTFSQNKSDEEKLKKMLNRYDDLLSVENTNDKHLKEFMEEYKNEKN